MRLTIDRTSPVSRSYRSERARGLFNVTEVDGSSFRMEADLPVEDGDWAVGVVVGSSGSGKSSIGAEIAKNGFSWHEFLWSDEPIIDAVDVTPGVKGGTSRTFDQVTGVLSSVGLGSVPAWLRPYQVLSNGEKFRADCAAMLLHEDPSHLVVDEFTSVLDRTVATLGAAAFVKAWRRQKGRRIVLLTCHHDVLDWVEPDWVFDTDKRMLFLTVALNTYLGIDQYPEVGRLVIRK
jgi:ABC-type ATPase with predicted acetyltransferase domain